MRKVFIYNLDRVLLIFLLLINEEELNDITYVCYEEQKEKIEKLDGKKIYLSKNRLENFNKREVKKYIEEIRRKIKEEILDLGENEVEIYGLDQFAIGKKIFYDKNINLIEEGTKNYTYFTERKRIKVKLLNLRQKMLNMIYGIKERKDILGYGKKVNKIYLTTSLVDKIGKPLGLERKNVEIINLKDLWRKKTRTFQQRVLKLFDFNEEILERKNKKNIIILTQPLCEDFDITEEEQIELYKKIIEKYPKEKIIIKPHPRDIVNYGNYFPEYYVIKGNYPVEFLDFFDIEIEKAVTLFSSGAFCVGNGETKIDFYGTEVDERLYKIFGTQDNIIKRNAFL